MARTQQHHSAHGEARLSHVNTIRSVGTNNNIMTGKSYGNIVFVDVRWEWLTFPLTLLMLSIVLFAATIVKTSDSTTASAAMPTLIYGLLRET